VEYQVIRRTIYTLQADPNELVRDGWRLVTMCPDPGSDLYVLATVARSVST
jgi:hypothetical protein